MNIAPTMSQPTFTSYRDYIKDDLLDTLARYEQLGVPLPNRKLFFENYAKHHGLSEWLAAIKGVVLTENQAYSIATTYLNVNNRKVSDLVSIFVCLDRLHQITLPIQYKILTTEYWEKRLNRENLQITQ
jgi:hypothetical protein